jgi:hypothetical protein
LIRFCNSRTVQRTLGKFDPQTPDLNFVVSPKGAHLNYRGRRDYKISKLSDEPTDRQCRRIACVIDLASGKVYPGVKSIKQRLKEAESACGQIASLWPGITQ